MSAICGIMSEFESLDSKQAQTMLEKLGAVKYDVRNEYYSEKYFTGCFLNKITPESENELLPFESDDGFVLNADAILYNREELFLKLDISEEMKGISDSQLILRAYKKWGNDCVKHLIGSFAFVIWDKEKQELFAARDHTGARTFFYYYEKGFFAFSSLVEPLFELPRIKTSLNEVYIADFLAITTVKHGFDPSATIFENIFMLPPAHTMTVNKNGISFSEYWSIEKIKKIRYSSDEEYEAAFLKLYRDVVKSRIRTDKNIGILLSGGLDSTSAACLACGELKKSGKALYSYTQVPMKNFVDTTSERRLADETEYVEETVAFCKNIIPKYIDSEGKNVYNSMERSFGIFEHPFKSVGNSTWIYELQSAAADDGCGVLLTGQVGNGTVSWGSHSCYMTHLARGLHFASFLKEAKRYAKKHKINPMKYSLVKLAESFTLTNKLLKSRKKNSTSQNLLLINPEFYKAMKMDERMKKFGHSNEGAKINSSKLQRQSMLSSAAFSHGGALTAKCSMHFGFEVSDPTGDVRIIEFCLGIPENQWVRDGNERRFIRRAFKGVMPDKIRLNDTIRGRQGADIVQRAMPMWNEIRAEMLKIGDSELERKYLNIPLIKELLKKHETLIDNPEAQMDIRLLLRALVFVRFLNKNTNY